MGLFKALLIFIVLFCFDLKIQAQNFEWAKMIGNQYGEQAFAIAYDKAGNSYVTGTFYENVDFDPGPGTLFLNAGSSYDMFIVKFNPSGYMVWAKDIQGAREGQAIAVDDFGNVYTTGESFGGDFDPGPGIFTLTSAGSSESFTLKLDSLGNFVWAKKIGGTNSDEGYGITVDTLGNVYTIGRFWGSVDFDPGTGSFLMTATGTEDAFIQKLNSSGNFLWAKKIGGTSSDEPLGILIDNLGDIIISGFFQVTTDFDPGTGVFNLSSFGSTDAFVLKLNSFGNFIFAKQFGGTLVEYGNCVTIDNNGNIFSTGYFQGTADFDPGPGVYNLISAGGSNMFVSKINSTGDFVWAKGFASSGYSVGSSIALDDSANVFIVGGFGGTCDFNPGIGVNNLIASGTSDGFISKLDSSGNFKWAYPIGSIDNSEATESVVIDKKQNILFTGSVQYTTDFDPQPSIYNLTPTPGSFSSNTTDFFVCKWSHNPCATENVLYPIGCNNITENGITYTFSGVFTQTLTNSTSCDSVITLFATVNSSDSVIDVQSGCDSLIINGQTYDSTGIYTQLLSNSYGCDSILTLNITIGTIDSNVVFQESCDSIIVNGQVYFTSGLYQQTLVSSLGCDSILKLDLVIHPNIDESIFQTGSVLTANAVGVSYQWINCLLNLPIPGEINQNYTVTSIGSYAVILSDGFCSDTTSCITITSDENYLQNLNANKIIVSPNPTSGFLTLSNIGNLSEKIILKDVLGRNLLFLNPAYKNLVIDLNEFENGIYYINMIFNTHTQTIKVVKN